MVVLSLLESRGCKRWRDSACPRRRRLKAILFHLRCRTSDLDRRCLERKRLGLSNLACICVLHFVALARFSSGVRVHIHRVAWWWAPAAGARRHGTEAWGVGCGLRAELGEVEIGAGAVTHGHGLAELALGPEAVEDDAVDGDNEDFDYDFDDAAYEGPILVVR
jgi:hypothetical protein